MAKKIFYGWWIVFACFLIGFYVGSVVFFGFTAFFEPIREEFGWSYTQISIAASLRGLEMGLFAPLIGYFADRFGSRKVSLCGVIAVGCGIILLSRTQSLLPFYFSFIVIGLGAAGCAGVVLTTAVGNWFHKKIGLAIGVTISGFGLSGLFIPLIVHLIEMHGWRTTLIILGVGMWALGIPLSLIIRDKPEQYGDLPDGGMERKTVQDGKLENQEKEVGFKEAIRHRAFLYLVLVDAIRMLGVMAVITHVMPYLSSVGIPRSTAGLVAGAIPVVSIIGRLGLGQLADVFDKKILMILSLLLMSLGLMAFCYVQSGWLIILFLMFFSPGFGGMMVLRGAFVREYFGRGSLGKLLGLIRGSAALGGILGPTLAGMTFDALGNYQPIWLIFSALSALGIIFILKIEKTPAWTLR
jgi:OFA family oxalate/formate antiporter-like MFS transporter